jgi:SWI/SNF-related matrix-associated actin-dependent regulator of chromatin subfamily A-like protein 1
LLILCPSALKDNWKKELQKWEIEDEDCVVNVVTKGTDSLKALVNIVSYSLASREPMLTKLLEKKFKVVLCDESHFLKDDKAKRTSNISPIIKNSKRAILLSGTASPSKPIELFTQIKALKFHKLNKTAFGKRYCDMKNVKNLI